MGRLRRDRREEREREEKEGRVRAIMNKTGERRRQTQNVPRMQVDHRSMAKRDMAHGWVCYTRQWRLGSLRHNVHCLKPWTCRLEKTCQVGR